MSQKETLKLLDKSFNYKQNIIKINKHNTFQHELAKFLVAWELMQNGQDIITEAIFNNGKRADILSLNDGMAYEVLKTESMKSFNQNKNKLYPCPVIAMNAEQVIKQNMDKFTISPR